MFVNFLLFWQSAPAPPLKAKGVFVRCEWWIL